jgi:hypothetical protein
VPAHAPAPDWSCTERGGSLPNWSHPAALASDQVLAVHAVEAYSGRGLGGLTLRACDASDATCAAPLATATTDDAGVATLVIHGTQPAGAFDGYVEATGGSMPANLVFFDGRTANGDGFFDVVLYTTEALGISAALAGVKLDPQRAVVRIEAQDCAHAPAHGVGLGVSTSDRQTTLAYSTGGGAGLASGGPTDATGVAVAFGVKDGGFGVHEGVGQHGVGGALALARAGAVSSVVALP